MAFSNTWEKNFSKSAKSVNEHVKTEGNNDLFFGIKGVIKILGLDW